MKDYLKQLIETEAPDQMKRNRVREYLQARILQAVQESGSFVNWAFHGGPALRFLYSTPRYSEDLDFSLIDPSLDSRFRNTLQVIKRTFEIEGYQLSVKINDKKGVNSSFVRFQKLLYDLGLSSRPAENISIKLEVDTNPPAGAGWETTLIRRHVTLNLVHHDKASLLAGKLHAFLARPFVKGGDLYDLIWYLSDPEWPDPNLVYLNEALSQTGWKGKNLTHENWKKEIRTRIKELNWDTARQDVEPFLERQKDADLLTRDNCLRLLKSS